MQFRPSAPLEYRGADEGSFQLSRWYELKMEDYVALQAHFYAVFGHDLSIYAVPATFSSRKKSSHQNFPLWIALAMYTKWDNFELIFTHCVKAPVVVSSTMKMDDMMRSSYFFSFYFHSQ